LKPSSSADALDRIDPTAAQYTYASLFKQENLDDYYALLGLSDLTYSASTAEIRKAYKTVSIVIHPDKAQSDADQDHCNELFKATQKAYETLIDPVKRRQYDSSLDFDDTIPDEDEIRDALKDDPVNVPIRASKWTR
jgi:curved DNA-binding protein CbpA